MFLKYYRKQTATQRRNYATHSNKVPATTLGKTGLQVSRVCLGTMSFGEGKESSMALFGWTQNKETVLPLVKRAWEAGINFYDSANLYSLGHSEIILGECIRDLKIPRDSVVIATKFANPMGPGLNQSGRSRKHILDACDASLKRLGTDHIDLYIVHNWNTNEPLEETMNALNSLVTSGRVRYLGTSNMQAWHLVQANSLAEKHGWEKFSSVQNLYNLIARDDEMELFPAANTLGIGLTPWSPLGMGFLTGSRKKGKQADTARSQSFDNLFEILHPRDSDWLIIDRIAEIATKRGVSPSQIALSWVLSKPEISSPIIGATKMAHLEDAIAATNLQLTDSEIQYLEELYQHRGWAVPKIRSSTEIMKKSKAKA